MIEKIEKLDMYQVFTYFLILSFAGWIFETTAVFILQGQLTQRGLLFVSHNLASKFSFLKEVPILSNLPFIWGLPVIPIYGFGGVIMVFGFKKLLGNVFLLFFVSMIAMTLFELIGSYFCQYILHKQYWDYSNELLNFQGRICLRSSVAWGVLSLIVGKLLTPELRLIYQKITKRLHYRIILIILFIFFVFCSMLKYFII